MMIIMLGLDSQVSESSVTDARAGHLITFGKAFLVIATHSTQSDIELQIDVSLSSLSSAVTLLASAGNAS